MQEDFKVGDRIEWAINGDFGTYKDCFDKDCYDTGEIVGFGNYSIYINWDSGSAGSCFLADIRKLPQTETSTGNNSPTPHKHKDLIIAWANGEEIEWFDTASLVWELTTSPVWSEKFEYRIKPKNKEPIVRTMFVEAKPSFENVYNEPNLRLTFDGESHKLISAEVLN